MAKKVINEISGIVFSLPWIVARDEGLFAEENLEVEFVRAGERRQRFSSPVADHKLVESIVGHQVFEDGAVELYRACEWGQVRRAYDSNRGGQILSKRSAVGVMGIYSRKDSKLTHPQTLRGKSIAVNFHAGSHYAGIQMLEGFLTREEINVVHVGGPQERYEALVNGDVDAAALMEPWNTIAEINDHQKVIETHYAGAEIGASELDADTYQALNRAIRKAVRLINSDKKKYVHYLIEDLPEAYRAQISPDDFHLPRLRYVDPEPYAPEEFQQTFDWMVDWGLVDPNTSYEDLVDNRISVSV